MCPFPRPAAIPRRTRISRATTKCLLYSCSPRAHVVYGSSILVLTFPPAANTGRHIGTPYTHTTSKTTYNNARPDPEMRFKIIIIAFVARPSVGNRSAREKFPPKSYTYYTQGVPKRITRF